jgi:hypothetical protein
MIVEDTIAAEQICEFLSRLMYKAQRPVFLIWDRHPVYRSRRVKENIASFEGSHAGSCRCGDSRIGGTYAVEEIQSVER